MPQTGGYIETCIAHSLQGMCEVKKKISLKILSNLVKKKKKKKRHYYVNDIKFSDDNRARHL